MSDQSPKKKAEQRLIPSPTPRTNAGRFAKGAASPNPGGRPKETAEVRELARQHTNEAIHTLAEIMADAAQPPAARVAAASALLDRGFGKPSQSINLDAQLSVAESFRPGAVYQLPLPQSLLDAGGVVES